MCICICICIDWVVYCSSRHSTGLRINPTRLFLGVVRSEYHTVTIWWLPPYSNWKNMVYGSGIDIDKTFQKLNKISLRIQSNSVKKKKHWWTSKVAGKCLFILNAHPHIRKSCWVCWLCRNDRDDEFNCKFLAPKKYHGPLIFGGNSGPLDFPIVGFTVSFGIYCDDFEPNDPGGSKLVTGERDPLDPRGWISDKSWGYPQSSSTAVKSSITKTIQLLR